MITSILFSTARKYLITALLPFFTLFAMLMAAPVWAVQAESVIATVKTGITSCLGSITRGVAVNSVTNKIYVINCDYLGYPAYGNSVTVIDGVTHSTTSVAVGNFPLAIALNPDTNKIYVANANGSTVTVMDGVTNTTTTVAVGGAKAIAVNPVTNKIYVADNYSNTFTVIDGATNSTTTVAAGSGPTDFNNPNAIAVNQITNKIYVANTASNTVTVIDGTSNSTSTVAVGTSPSAIAVDPVTNKIYVANTATAPQSGNGLLVRRFPSASPATSPSCRASFWPCHRCRTFSSSSVFARIV